MYHYATSCSCTSYLDEKWLQAAREAQIPYQELAWDNSISEAEQKQIICRYRELTEDGIMKAASIHVPFDQEMMDLSNPDEAKRKAWIPRFYRYLESSAVFGASLYTIHGSQEPNPPEMRPAMITALRRSLEEIAPELEKRKLILNLELLPRTCIGNSPEDLEEIVRDMPECIGLNLDVNHLNNRPEAVPDLIPRLAPRLHAMHLSDYDGVDECHWYPGLGVLNWTKVIQNIRAVKNDLLLIFECFEFIRKPNWQGRPDEYVSNFAGVRRNAFFLEHAEELEARIGAFQIL